MILEASWAFAAAADEHYYGLGQYQDGALDLRGRTIECRTGMDASWEVWKEFTPERVAKICEVPAGQIRHIAMDYARATHGRCASPRSTSRPVT